MMTITGKWKWRQVGIWRNTQGSPPPMIHVIVWYCVHPEAGATIISDILKKAWQSSWTNLLPRNWTYNVTSAPLICLFTVTHKIASICQGCLQHSIWCYQPSVWMPLKSGCAISIWCQIILSYTANAMESCMLYFCMLAMSLDWEVLSFDNSVCIFMQHLKPVSINSNITCQYNQWQSAWQKSKYLLARQIEANSDDQSGRLFKVIRDPTGHKLQLHQNST